ncbi:PTS sugar transporter subunit IIA [Ligilactobacillus equi]|uniref:PTS system transporter subunit IIA n=1 Tax=Ligilactobacillus equi DSM 15833 = JCM 10991 TaxID=1423740 RepID=A0A0R1T337_9LACO|nr:PTS sugar transporter subunit IIA [Ligilactobacillus equi]KRL76246.1 PTS system transporter subunit IIA [Ligilactobacillus equi DSM 15833 = JCM 10991]
MSETKPVSIETYFDLNVKTKQEAISKIGAYLADKGFVIDVDAFVADVFSREDELPTYIGHNIGLPHSKSDHVKNAVVVVGRLNNPIIWNNDNQVDLIFLIAVPKKSAGDLHLKILAQLARSLMHEDFRNGLRNLDSEEVKQLMYDNTALGSDTGGKL